MSSEPGEVVETISRFKGCRQPEEDPSALYVSQSGPWTNVLPDLELASAGFDWAQLLSNELNTTSVCFFALEGLWEYAVFDKGRIIAGMDARSDGRVFLYGNVKHACGLLGITESTLKSYCRSYPIPERLQDIFALVFQRDYGESIRAFQGDEFAPWDEWAHCDLATKFKATYPEPIDDNKIELETAGESTTWPTFPESGDPSKERYYPIRWPWERLHPRNWP